MSTEADKKLIDELFKTFDESGNGKLSVKELKIGLRQIGNPTKEDMKVIFDEMNVKKGQEISKEQFERTMKHYFDACRGMDPDKELRASFKVFDRNGNGFIDKKELTCALTGLGEKMTLAQVDQMFKSIDADNDGKVNYEEFIKLYQKKPLQQTAKK